MVQEPPWPWLGYQEPSASLVGPWPPEWASPGEHASDSPAFPSAGGVSGPTLSFGQRAC